MPEAQETRKILDEFEKVIDNYAIIVDEARILDPSNEGVRGTIFDCYIPKLKKELRLLGRLAHVKRILSKIDELESKVERRVIAPWRSESYDNPLTLLLSLAIEQGAITDSRETKSGNDNWGRLGKFRDYLEGLDFKSSTNKKGTQYWPGLPYCVMALIPIWSPKNKYKISVAASSDQFEFLGALSEHAFKCRKARMKCLRKSLDEETQERIDEMINFSKTLRDNPYSETLWMDSRKLQEDADATEKNFLYSLKPCDLKQHKDWPVYLPVVISTWKPNGEYMRACALDRVRFIASRPPAAERKENIPRYMKKPTGNSESQASEIPSETGCAEWVGFLNWINQQKACTGTWY